MSSSDSDFGEDESKTPLGFGKPWLKHRMSSAPQVSVGFAGSLRKVRDVDIDVAKELAAIRHDQNLEYSDIEEDDVTSATAMDQTRDRDAPGWSPDFMRRHRESGGTSTTSQRTVVERSPVILSAPAPDGAVRITPSLIKAIDRIAVAQQATFSAAGIPPKPGFSSSNSSKPAEMTGLARAQISPSPGAEEDKSAQWDAFWRDVHEKAVHAR